MDTTVDLVVRGGELADGSGGPLVEADVAIDDGRIVAVGRVAARGREEIDARGCLVTPGFVDLHTHYDGQAVWDTRLAPSSWHGVTTAVMGNCGVGFAPVKPADRERLIELMEGVEDIPGAALHEGLDWRWESFAGYLDAVDRQPRDIDLCAQLPHGALRVYVMGERAARLEPANADDVAQMRVLAAEAMRAGAIGFSTTRSINHRSVKGEPTPSLRATADELMGIALGLADAGRGVLQFISDFDTPSLEAEWAMLCSLVRASGRPLSFSLAQRHSVPGHWRRLLDLTAQAVAEGLPICAQVAPRPIGVLLGLQGSRSPFSACASFRPLAGLPLAGRVAALRDPALRERLLAEVRQAQPDPAAQRLVAFDRIFPFGDPPDYEPPAATSFAAQAARCGRPAAELAYDALLQDEGRALLFAPFANYADFNLDVCHAMLADANTVPGLGDGGAHVSVISDGSFPTTLLAHWGRDRSHGRFPLPWLVKRQTADTARAVGLHDRGRIAVGLKGDLNVIDMARLALEAPRMAADLPAGGKRLLQRSRGYVATVVSGVPVYREGQATGALPGRLVRA
ncbi:MAG: amidohydrolase family protein [Burkholderiales bacterium]|nr:amidohydrolase family protein [Burkholderiales bacterium]